MQTKLSSEDVNALRALLTEIKTYGFRAVSIRNGQEEEALRDSLTEKANLLFLGDGVNVAWSIFDKSSNKDWLPRKDTDYSWPAEIHEISDLLHMYFIDVGLYLLENAETALDSVYSKLSHLVDEYLKRAETVFRRAIDKQDNDHICVHLYEVMTTFCLTIVELHETITLDNEEEGQLCCHPLLGGLTVANYCLESKAGLKNTQRSRAPSPLTNRTGKEVSFEELANVFRTSRVTLSNVYNRSLDSVRKKLEKADNFRGLRALQATYRKT